MKSRFFLFLLFLTAIPTFVNAQQADGNNQPVSMADLFRQMPDSLMPYLSKNNRLDMLDFMEAGMTAEVTNLLDGKSQMTFLTDDSLAIEMNNALHIGMKRLPTDGQKGSVSIRVVRSYQSYNGRNERVTDVYNSEWQRLAVE